MLGAAASRPRLSAGLTDFVRRTQIPFFNTQMGKGTVAGGHKLYLGTAALSERDYVHEAIDRADLIIAIGHDTIEKPPFLMGPRRAAGDPHQLHAGQCRAGLLPACRGGGRRRPQPGAAGRPARGQARRRPRRWPPCARKSWRGSRIAPPKAASRRRRSGSCTMSARSCRRTASSPSTTACTRSGSPATTAPGCPTPCCSTTRWRRWERGCPRR